MKKKKIVYPIPEIKDIVDPSFLHNLNYNQLDTLSKNINDYIIDVTSKKGGHLSSNLGVVDSTIALCRSFDFSKDKIIFDVGHQCYTYKILTGRPLTNFREQNGISGFQKLSESKYDHFECGHSSTSISVALGMAIARDLNHEQYNIISFIGDASIVNGLAFEGLNYSAVRKNKIIIVVNDNDMSISKPVGGVAKAFRNFSTSSFYGKSKTLFRKIFYHGKIGKWFYRQCSKMKNWLKNRLLSINIFDTLGFSVIGPIDGHNIKNMEKAFSKAKKLTKSVVIILKTVKGKGYSYAENDELGTWHGVDTFDKQTGAQIQNDFLSWGDLYNDFLFEKMKSDLKTVTVVPATGYGSHLLKVFETYPERCFDVGIAEEHAITMASGLAISGFHPIISIYSTFLQRGYDEVSHDLARLNLNATFLIDRSGFVGKDGNTHQGIYDESFLMTIPNVTICMASNINNAEFLFNESFNNHGPYFIRYPKQNFLQSVTNKESFQYGKWILEKNGKSTAIIAVGPEVETLKIMLKDSNVTLINALYQKPLDRDMLHNLIHYNHIIIYDAYSTSNGFANSVAKELLLLGYKGKTTIKSIPDTFVDQATIFEQKQQFGLLPEDIIKLI